MKTILKKMTFFYSGFIVSLFFIFSSQLVQAEASLTLVPSSPAPGEEVQLIVGGVDSSKYYCVYVEGTPESYNACNSPDLPKFTVTGVNTLTIPIPQDVAPQDYKLNVEVYDNPVTKTNRQLLSGLIKINSVSAQTTPELPNPQFPDQSPVVLPNTNPNTTPPTGQQPPVVNVPTPFPPSGNCAELGLVNDAMTGLCLPPNTIKADAGSIAGSVTIGEVIQRVVKILLTLGGAVAVVFLMIGGYQYVMSRGSEDMAKKGKSTMTASIIGLIAILLAYTIVNIVTNFITLGTGSLFN